MRTWTDAEYEAIFRERQPTQALAPTDAECLTWVAHWAGRRRPSAANGPTGARWYSTTRMMPRAGWATIWCVGVGSEEQG